MQPLAGSRFSCCVQRVLRARTSVLPRWPWPACPERSPVPGLLAVARVLGSNAAEGLRVVDAFDPPAETVSGTFELVAGTSNVASSRACDEIETSFALRGSTSTIASSVICAVSWTPPRHQWRSRTPPRFVRGHRSVRSTLRRLRLHPRISDRSRYADSRAQTIYAGTTEVMKELLARSLQTRARDRSWYVPGGTPSRLAVSATVNPPARYSVATVSRISSSRPRFPLQEATQGPWGGAEIRRDRDDRRHLGSGFGAILIETVGIG